MLHKQRYFDHHGREVAEHEAMRAGVLRDGFSLRVPTVFRDSRFRDGKQLWASGQPAVTDGDATGSSGNRPGWRVAASPINRQALYDARASYIHDLENSWRNPLFGRAAPRDLDEDQDEDENMRASDRCTLTVDELNERHQRNMSKIYDSYAAEISRAYRSGK
jgi:hypothetical protein